MQNQPYVPVSKPQGTQSNQTALIIVLALLGLALLALSALPRGETVQPATNTINNEAVNPELRLADRYTGPAVAPEIGAAANPELAAHQRYVAEQAAIRATVQAPASMASAANPELAAHQRYVAEQAAIRATVEAPALAAGAGENPQDSLPAFKQSR